MATEDGPASANAEVKLWECQGKAERTLTGHTADVLAVAFSPDGELLATASQDQTIKLWNVPTGRALLTLRGHSGRLRSVPRK